VKRREFLSLICGATLAPQGVAHAQTGASKQVGILMSAPLPPLETFRQALDRLGYRNGENIRFEDRFAGSSEDRYPELATDLVARGTDLIVTWGTPATLAAKRATSTIPIVMAAVGDPLGIGAVPSLGRPGGNITGLSTLNTELESKRLEILKEIVPNLTRVGVLTNATSAYAIDAVQRLRREADARRITVHEAAVRDRDDLDSQLQALARARPDAVVIVADSFLTAHHARIAQGMAESRLPAIYGYREAAIGGGLISYGTDYHELFRRAAGYVDKIFKGAKPGDLPIEQPTRFELIVNLNAAKALGMIIPDSFLLRADEVIE
jgi:putative tryptophan/tyrosine transport system substrate-binding protein